jgi:Fe-S cluster assembly protein SufD
LASPVLTRAGRGWLQELRERGTELAARLPWPTTQEEEWRRTSLAGLKLEELEAGAPGFPTAPVGGNGKAPAAAASRPGKAPAAPPEGQAGLLSFRGGQCTGLALAPEWRRKGVILAALDGEVPDPVAALMGSALERADNRLAAWHLGSLSHGALLYVPEAVELDGTVTVDLQEQTAGASFPHLAVVLGRGARAVVEQRLTGSGRLVNAGLEALLGDGAALQLYLLQDLDPGSLFFSHAYTALGRDASLHSLEAHLGARLVKTRLDCSLEGPGAESHLNGAYLAGAGQHMDLRTVQRHRSPKATSRALYKGAVKDSGRTVYQGLIEVCPGAAGTDAYLSNKNLVLNDGARADSIPSLRIDNNDVRCTHGSTTGRISPEELFYLGSRGLPPEEARAMLVRGYFEELLGRAPFAEAALAAVARRLAG